MSLHSCTAQWLRCRASDSRVRDPGFESCAAVLRPWARFFTLHCSSSLCCINEYLAIYSGGCTSSLSHINCTMWLDASQRSWDDIWLNRSAGEVKCKSALSSPMDWILRYIKTYLLCDGLMMMMWWWWWCGLWTDVAYGEAWVFA